jgi:mRNA-degrading endonuclease RelE of RelBE toxin-antitoxin system
MPNQVFYTPKFEKEFKRFKKKHRSLPAEIKKLTESLIENPESGTPLGSGIYKIRLAVKSKGKGKSGGFRIITYLVEQRAESININLLTLYDKSEIESLSKQEISDIIKDIFS